MPVLSLRAEGLAVGHGGVALQAGLTLEVEPGRRLAVVGPSGCGKTTLLRALAWLDAPLAGALTLGGAAPRAVGFPQWRRRVIYVAQRATFFGDPVADELARPFAYRAASAAFDAGAARDALEAVGLAPKWEAASDTLSEGERQRLALVRAGLLGPDVLLLDEPTSALDEATASRVEEWLGALGCAVVLVSHDAAQRARLADETLTLEAPDA